MNKLSLSRTSLTTLVLAGLAAVFLTFRVLAGLLYPAAPSQASDLTVANILAAVNQERSSRNITTLNTNSILSAAADYKAHDMITRKYFSHTDPDGNYLWSKIAALGYAPYSMLGENLAIEFYSTSSLMQAWMDSPTHRANVLQEGFRDQGMGLAYGSVQSGEYGTSIANTFGTLVQKKAAAPPPPPAPAPKPAPAPAPKPAPAPAPKPAPAPAPTEKTPTQTSTEPVKSADVEVEEEVNEIFNLNTLTPRGLALALAPFFALNKEVTGEPSFQTGQNVQPPETLETQAPTPVYQNAPSGSGNPYQQYKLWGIIVAVGALALLAMETKRYLKKKIHIPHHRWNTILMLILTFLITALAYII